MEILKTMFVETAIILGIVQGITEFLPISSSGHLSLFQHFLGVGGEGSLLFSVLLHLGTLIAVFIVFYKTIFELVIESLKLKTNRAIACNEHSLSSLFSTQR